MNAFRIKFRFVVGITLAGLTQFITSPRLSAAESPFTSSGQLPTTKTSSDAFLNNLSGTSAVDANGVRHQAVDYPRERPPWLYDTVKAVAPSYPDRDRILRHEGDGLFQLMLDLKTGSVTKVTVIKSTGFQTLDTSVIASLRQWRWKAGKWKEIDIPVGFTIGSVRRPPWVPRLPPAGR